MSKENLLNEFDILINLYSKLVVKTQAVYSKQDTDLALEVVSKIKRLRAVVEKKFKEVPADAC